MIERGKEKYFLLFLLLLFSISCTYSNDTLNPDTSSINKILRNAKIALDSNKLFESFKLSKSALSLSNKLDYKDGLAASLYYIGVIQSASGSKDSAITTFRKSLDIYKVIDNQLYVGNTLYKIGSVFSDVGNQDSATFYLNEALKIQQNINDKNGLAYTINSIGLVSNAKGMYSKALENFFLSFSILDDINNKTFQPRVLANIGNVFWNQGDYKNALEFFLKALKIKEEQNDVKNAGFILNNIGLVYQQTGDYEMALKYLYQSLKIKESQGDKMGVSYSYSNLGDVYQMKGDYEKAMEFYRKAELIKKELSNFSSLANLYVYMGKLYRTMKESTKSLDILNEAEKIYTKLNEPNGTANCYLQLGLTHFELGNKKEAISYCLQGIDKAQKIGALELVKQGYDYLSKMYERSGQIVQAFDSYKLFIVFRDSISSIEKSKEIVKVQMEVEFDQLMQKQRLEQEKKLAVIQGKSKKQTTIANFFILAFTITLTLLIVFYYNYKQKQRHNNLLAFQKLDMEHQKSVLIAQRDELEIQKNLVVHQRDKIMNMLTELGESIDYARKIQQALLPSDNVLKSTIGEYFLLFQPRESVGGDFYWVLKNENTIFFAIGDCTGHGIPGGFMSMLSVSLLNEISSHPDCTSPKKILWELREMIIKALNQTGKDEDSMDGMDIALCMYNPANRHLVYSGANLSLLIATTTPSQPSERIFVQENIIELKADRMPVAFYQRMDNFNEHHVVLNPGDSLYLFSDGYSDQFGGPANKKFGYNAFRSLISRVSKEPFEKQRDIMWYQFDKWKGEENQTDDVIVMGIKIS